MCVCLTIVAILVAWRTSRGLWWGRQLCARERGDVLSHRERDCEVELDDVEGVAKKTGDFKKLRLPKIQSLWQQSQARTFLYRAKPQE